VVKCDGMQGNAVVPPPLIYDWKRSRTSDCYNARKRHTTNPECSILPPLIYDWKRSCTSRCYNARERHTTKPECSILPPLIYDWKRSCTSRCYNARERHRTKPECSVPPPLILHFNHCTTKNSFFVFQTGAWQLMFVGNGSGRGWQLTPTVWGCRVS